MSIDGVFDYTVNSAELRAETSIPFDEKAFEVLFKNYYVKLVFFANKFLNDQQSSEEVVSETFTCLWEERTKVHISRSVSAYLYRSVQNRCLNYLKHKKIESEYVNYLARHNMLTEIPALNRNPCQEKEIEQQLKKAIEELPEKCRAVFKLSRFENLKNREIAETLQISEKTVERHMTIALERLRQCIRHFLILLAVLLNF